MPNEAITKIICRAGCSIKCFGDKGCKQLTTVADGLSVKLSKSLLHLARSDTDSREIYIVNNLFGKFYARIAIFFERPQIPTQ